MFMFATTGLAGAAAVIGITKYHLDGPDLSEFDGADLATPIKTDPNSKGAEEVKAYLYENFIKPAAGKGSRAEKLAAKRKRFDEAGLTREFPGSRFVKTVAQIGDHSVSGEWVMPESGDPNRRLLYIHGGANTVGSAISHRAITSNIAERAKCSVLAINYRLMPEHSRMDGIEDCRLAYRWMLENGPNGPSRADKIAVAGDSAGGNLTLSLINWVRDQNLRAADAVIAISPATDSTCTSPSIKGNFDTDLMLKPLAAPLVKIPRPALLWLLWRSLKITPSSPVVSPVFADLSGLPPTLVHVSAHEMLYDDARRYVAKAQKSGSPARLQSWEHMAHVWHIFDRMLPEARDALDEINNFLQEHGFSSQ